MNIIRSKSTTKYLNKTFKKVVARRTKYFRRNLHVNHEDTFIRIIRITSDEQFDIEARGYKSFPGDICFFINHIDTMFNYEKLLDINDSEFILTDSKTNRIISLNQKLKNYPDFINIWIVKKNTISFLKLKENDFLYTR